MLSAYAEYIFVTLLLFKLQLKSFIDVLFFE